MSTATKSITDTGTPINVSGYTTFPGVALQGRTPAAGAGGTTHSSAGLGYPLRRFSTGNRVKLLTPSGGK